MTDEKIKIESAEDLQLLLEKNPRGLEDYIQNDLLENSDGKTRLMWLFIILRTANLKREISEYINDVLIMNDLSDASQTLNKPTDEEINKIVSMYGLT